ncbi:MAG TPA: M50 family metallopeptidase [Candidatus Sulfotelmatobacter sp.]|nr:M50 family metallopeptidase [Candidatus Sulfotelmatobacter sp.]
MLARRGSVHLFRFSGIDVFLHWSWFLVAAYEIQDRGHNYSSIKWNILEYLGLFLIVLLHEFGHALACRQVGGRANEIVLWPLGGVAYVDPPPRPGATLWSIAAGPLVNVALLPILALLLYSAHSVGVSPNVYGLISILLRIDLGLFIFNILPIYPLDGGQILRSLLWFVMGRARSLLVATVLGLIGIPGVVALAFWLGSIWYGVLLAFFMLMNCWGGLQHARELLRFAKLPRRSGFACPSCKMSPPPGAFWRCGNCRQLFDTFETRAVCPHCGSRFPVTRCLDCGKLHPIEEWAAPTLIAPSINAEPRSQVISSSRPDLL